MSRIADKYPKIWTRLDSHRTQAIQKFQWNSRCYLPVPVMNIFLGQERLAELPADVQFSSRDEILKSLFTEERCADALHISVLAAWRLTQGIYRYHPDVLEALWDTPVTGDIPSEVLHALPEWCVYIETPHRPKWYDVPMDGFFALFDYDQQTEMLRFVIDSEGQLFNGMPIYLGGSLLDGLIRSKNEAIRMSQHKVLSKEAKGFLELSPEEMCGPLIPLLSTLLYLCAQNAEIRTRREGLRPTRPKPVKTKEGARYFPPPEPVPWEVGWRVGAAISAAKEEDRRPAPSGGTHARPKAHIRRAHWHSFWTGPKAKVGVAPRGERKMILHWLPPLPVNVTESLPVVPAIHPVEAKP